MKSFVNEFKAFIMRGNVMDMAVGMIVGAAFTTIVNSLVNDIVMPLISLLFGGISFSQWNLVFGEGEAAVSINFGTFIAAVINFLLVALVIFCVVRSINRMHDAIIKKPEEAPAEPTTKTCPYCLSEIPIAAVKCCCCTSDLPPVEIDEKIPEVTE